MELQDLIKKVEALVLTSVESNQQNYREAYKEAYGRAWSGCSCNKGVMRDALKHWLLTTKTVKTEVLK